MPGSLAKRTVIAAPHQSEPTGRVVADRGDLLLSPGCGRNPRSHANMIAPSTEGSAMASCFTAMPRDDLPVRGPDKSDYEYHRQPVDDRHRPSQTLASGTQRAHCTHETIWMQTTGATLVAIKRCSPMCVRMPAQDSRSVHGLLYLAAVRDDRRRKEHCQGRVDTGPASLTAPEAIGCDADADAVELGRSADAWPAPGPHVLAFHEDESVDWSDSFTPFCC
jgi:hypothetical protein